MSHRQSRRGVGSSYKATKVTKAAAISQAMLARKSSFKGRESLGLLGDLGLGEEAAEAAETPWWARGVASQVLKVASALSMLTVCVTTPDTYAIWALFRPITFGLDILITLLFSAEAALKMHHKGLCRDRQSYFRDRWCQFDFFMLICHWVSVMTQGLEYVHEEYPWFWYVASISVLRSPRPLIMIRFIRSVVNFHLPRNRLQQIFKRSSQQIYNVTIFFVFFMSLYGILGVQFFGRMDWHCVVNGTDPHNVTITDLAIPDTYCRDGLTSVQCPRGMVCMRLSLDPAAEGYYGMFNHFVHSLFTVYMAASTEGWVYVMYDCIDSLPPYKAFIYFTTLIFFLAWLVKNVFIAVITETFAEIRVQFSQIWASRETVTEEEFRQMLERDGDGLRLVTIDANKDPGWAPERFRLFFRSTLFQVTMMCVVLVNAICNAAIIHKHNHTDAPRKLMFYYIECGFTILFNVECVFKIAVLGWKGYIRRGIHKFELILVFGSSLNIIKPIYDSHFFTYFQVFRVARLIKASPMLEDFVYKIFGPGKKLGGLILFTVALLVITSAVSLQLFCFLPNGKFRTFPEALMSMFQILTQEGWTEIVVDVMRMTGSGYAVAVAVYFVSYHLFVTLIVLSLFVAVILDNLEMDEELKKIKQLKAREQTTSRRTELPLRLRLFTRFPDRPQMVTLKRLPSEFPLPKIRDSFTRCFADDDMDDGEDERNPYGMRHNLLGRAQDLRKRHHLLFQLRQSGQLTVKSEVTYLIEDSNKMRVLLSDSTGFIPMLGTRLGTKKQKDGRHKKGRGGQTGAGSIKMKQMYEHLKENGDLMSDTASKRERRGDGFDLKAFQQKKERAEMRRNRLEEELRENHPYFDCPLFLVGRNSRFRRLCQRLVYTKYIPAKNDPVTGKPIKGKYKDFLELVGLMTYLDWTMVILTCVSCISMMFETPWPLEEPHLIMNDPYLRIAEYLFVMTMTMELLLKILANGLFFTPKAFVRDFGGILTSFIYITSLLFLVWMPPHVEINSGAQLLMIFRAMRPLRIYTLVPHIRRVVVELFKGFKEILLVTVLLVVLMFIFASFGVQIAGGKLAKCNDPNITNRTLCKGTMWQKIHVTNLEVYGKYSDDMHPKFLVPRVWANPRNFNFDHVGNAMLSLFEILSFKGWNVVRDVILQRLGPWAAVFVHIYVFIGCMIGLTLFVGVVIANYSENRGTALLTVDQRRWNDLKNRLKMAQPLHVPPKPDESATFRTAVYNAAVSSNFKRFFTFLVVLNSCLLYLPWSVEEEELHNYTAVHGLTTSSAVITLLFVVEIIAKIIAFTLKGFWQSRRNRVDLLIVFLGLVWCILHFPVALQTNNRDLKTFTYSFGYVIVVLRFFTIAGRHSTLKMLMLTVVMATFRSMFIIIAMFLLMLFYAYAGVILFGMVKYGQALSRHANFRRATDALVVLFRIVTGEDWNEIMHDCMRAPPYCYVEEGAPYWETDCGNYFAAIVFFCSFYLIITYIVLNLLVAIIMENFSLFYSSEEDALLSYADLRNFQIVWNIVDQDQKNTIPVRRVKFLLRLLKGRLEVDPGKDSKDRILFKHMCYEMERLHNGDDVSFHDVLSMLSYRSVEIHKSLLLEELLLREELEYIVEEEVAKQTIRSWLEKCLRRMRSKEASTSIINSLRATNEQNIRWQEMDETKVDEKEERLRKKGAPAPKGRRGSGSIGTVVAEAAKKFLAPSSKVGSLDKAEGRKKAPELAEVAEEAASPSTGWHGGGLSVSPGGGRRESGGSRGSGSGGSESALHSPSSPHVALPEPSQLGLLKDWWAAFDHDEDESQ